MPAESPKVVFERLYRANYDRVLAYGLRRTDPERAVDATAETFTVAWRRLADVPGDPLPWLLGVARRVLANERRAVGRHEALVQRLARAPAGSGRDPADVVAAAAAMRAALGRLGPRDRELLMLLAWDGLSPDQAAASLGCSKPTLAVRLHRARRRMERELARESKPTSPESPRAGAPRSLREVS
jgi:RNA polymerase sigma-70 factor (ECF subfamily)